VSAGSPKTEYSEAIPSDIIEYAYVNDIVPAAKVSEYARKIQGMDLNETKVDQDEQVLLVQQSLPVQNGGTIFAVFSAKKLDGIGFAVFKELLLVFLLILTVSLASPLSPVTDYQTMLQVVEQITEFTNPSI